MADHGRPEEKPSADDSGSAMRRVGLTRRRFASLWLVPLLAMIALGSWAFASPIASSPDDDFHLTSIWCAYESSDTCLPGDSPTTRMVPSELIDARCFSSKPYVSASCQSDLFDHKAYPNTISKRGNFNGGYPPIYYAAMGVFAGPDVAISVLVMRAINVLLFVGFASVLFFLLPAARRPTLIWGWLLTTVPLGAFLIASNNPSAWAITGVGSAFLATLGYLESNGRRRAMLAGLIFLATLMAAGSRGDAALYVVIAIGSAMLLRASWSKQLVVTCIAPLTATLLAFALFLTSRQATASVTGIQGGAAPGESGGGTGIQLLFHNALHITSLWTGALGDWGLGWLDTTMPDIVPAASTAAFVAVGFKGLQLMSRRKAVVVSGVVVLLAAIPLFVLQQGGDAVGADVQPRYILPLICILGFVLVFESQRQSLTLSRAQRWAVVIALSTANAVALFANIRRYVTGVDNPGLNLSNGAEWWWDMPVPPMALWVIGSVTFALLVTILVRAAHRDTRSHS